LVYDCSCFFFQAEDGIRDRNVTGVQTCALPISGSQLVRPGISRVTDGVLNDWCAPPSGASVTPDGVPTTIDRPPAYRLKVHGSKIGRASCRERGKVAKTTGEEQEKKYISNRQRS